jgi:PASTA domain
MNRSFLRFGLVAAVTVALAGVVVPTAASRPVDSPWAGTGTGTTTVVSDGTTGPAVFTYSATGSEAEFFEQGSWNFSTVAKELDEDEDEDAVDEVDEDEDEDLKEDEDEDLEEDEDEDLEEDEDEELEGNTRTVQLAWTYTGFHSFFNVTVGLDAFVTRGGATTTTPLVNAGPVDCCTPPSGGFDYSGTTSLSVQAGDTYGFAMRGGHGDIADLMTGTLRVDDLQQPLQSPATARQPSRLACVVPKLTGKTARRAKIVLRKADCALGRISKEKVGKKVRPGRVLRSKPRAGKHLSRGAKVAVVVGRR